MSIVKVPYIIRPRGRLLYLISILQVLLYNLVTLYYEKCQDSRDSSNTCSSARVSHMKTKKTESSTIS